MLGRWWVVFFGLISALLAVLWLWAACGFPDGVAGVRAHLDASFDRFDAALPLAMVLACAAAWMVVVPGGRALRREDADPGNCVVAGCLVPLSGFLLVGWIVGDLVVRGPGDAGWSVWQDVVAQFCLPVGALAAVACGAMALGTREGNRLACWTSASSGGLALMAVGRADEGGMSAALLLALAQWLVLALWVLAAGHDFRFPAWRPWLVGACAASLAGIWPLPGGLARWRLVEEMVGGGFGMAWDGVLLVVLVLSWLMALIAWCGWIWRAARDGGTGTSDGRIPSG